MLARCVVLLGLASATILAGDQPLIEGNPDSALRVVIYEDLQCPDCAAFRQMLDEKLLPRFGGKVAFVHRDFPLPRHNWARRAAIASRYFQSLDPEIAVAFRRYALAHLKEISSGNFSGKLAEFARSHSADPDRAVAALNESELDAEVERDYQDGIARGVAHTPTVLVSEQPFIEQFSFEDIAAAIERALSGK